MSLDNKIITRRDILGFFGGAVALTAYTASGLLVPIRALAADTAAADGGAKDPRAEATAEQSSRQIRVIPVVRDMTGNLVMGYIASQAGIDLKKYATDDARKLLTVQFGKNSPKEVPLGSLDKVVVGEHITWRPRKERARVTRDASKIDYLSSGDALLLHLSKFAEADRKKLVAKYDAEKINISTAALNDYVAKKHARRVNAVRQAVKKAAGENSDLAKKYEKMTPLQVMARDVTPELGKKGGMYEALAAQGVNFVDVVEYAESGGKLDQIMGGPVHRADLAQPYVAIVFSYLNKKKELRNFGQTPDTGGDGVFEIRYTGTMEQLKEILGANDFEIAMRKAVAERTRVTSGFDKVFHYFHGGKGSRAEQVYNALMKNNEVIDSVGLVTQRYDFGRWFTDNSSYQLKTAGVQVVSAKK